MEDVLIFDAIRTPRGRADATGALRELRPYRLLSTLMRALASRNPGLDTRALGDVLIGCVGSVGDQGYNVAQAAVQDAQWSDEVPAATVSRFAASGLETVHQAAARIAAGWDSAIVAGGLEVVSRVPLGAGGGALLEDPELILREGVLPRGVAADLVATIHGFTREALDEYAAQSQQRAAAAIEAARFERAIAAIHDANAIAVLVADELPSPRHDLEYLRALRPAFTARTLTQRGRMAISGFDALALSRYPELSGIHHRHTAGNSARLADGAALVLLGGAAFAKTSGAAPRAVLRSIAVASTDATVMLTGFLPAAERALGRAGLTAGQIDLFEVNESFGVLPLLFARHFDVGLERINVYGGAIAFGHPVGATGAMLLGTLIDALHDRGERYGLACVSASGGQGIACVVEVA